MTLASGDRLGSYEVQGPLGAGGMGEVYRATDARLKRDVALKVLPAAFVADRERLARFEREAQLLAQLQHPNIASIYGIEEAEGVRALVMELVPGLTLAERMAAGALPLEETLSSRARSPRRSRRRTRRDRPPRPQAAERQGHRRRHGEGARLRARQGDGGARQHGGRRRRAFADDHELADAHRRARDPARCDPRHGGLHGARTGGRRRRRPARRHLGVRRRALRDALGAPAVRGRDGLARPRRGAQGRTGFRRAPRRHAAADRGASSAAACARRRVSACRRSATRGW
ncbi:MAG: protein kinase [Thermoanaerobaculia bacterium]